MVKCWMDLAKRQRGEAGGDPPRVHPSRCIWFSYILPLSFPEDRVDKGSDTSGLGPTLWELRVRQVLGFIGSAAWAILLVV